MKSLVAIVVLSFGALAGIQEESDRSTNNVDVVFNFHFTQETSLRPERLEGRTVHLGQYESTPISMSGSQGTCHIDDVPPGTHELRMTLFKIRTKLEIPEKEDKSVTVNVRISRNISIHAK